MQQFSFYFCMQYLREFISKIAVVDQIKPTNSQTDKLEWVIKNAFHKSSLMLALTLLLLTW